MDSDRKVVDLIRGVSANVYDREDLPARVTAGIRGRRRRRRWAIGAGVAMTVALGIFVGVVAFNVQSRGSGSQVVAIGSAQSPVSQIPGSLLNWPIRGDRAGDPRYLSAVLAAADAGWPDGGLRVVSSARVLFVGSVPSGLDAAIVEGLDRAREPVVLTMVGPAHKARFKADGGERFTQSLSATPLVFDISFSLTSHSKPGFVVVVGAPGTYAIDLSIAPRQQEGFYGPDLRSLPLNRGVGATGLPPGADPLKVFYTVGGPRDPNDYSHVWFTMTT